MQIQVLPQIDATVCKPVKRPDFQSGHRKMCAGSNPVRSTNGNDVTQVVTLVCKTRAFGRCEFESRHSHNKGERQRWRVGLVCKTSGLRLSGFDSHLSHKNEKRLGRLKKITYLCKRIKNGPLVKRLTRYPFTVEARVRTPYGLHR